MIDITIIILAGRDINNLKNCLAHIDASKSLPREIIIVIDLNYVSYDASKNITGIKKNLKIIEYSGNGKQPEMRNLAIDASKSNFLWFIDDDVEIFSNALNNIDKLIGDIKKNEDIACVACRIDEALQPEIFRKIKKLKIPVTFSLFRGPIGFYNWSVDQPIYKNIKYYIGKSGNKYPIVPFAQGTSMIFRKKDLIEIGGFNVHLGTNYSSFEDSEPSLALYSINKKTVYCDYVGLRHLKLPRIDGSEREFDQEFFTAFIKNYYMSVVINRYPNRIFSYFLVIFFCLGVILKSIKDLSLNFTVIPLFFSRIKISFISVVNGLIQGHKGIIMIKKCKRKYLEKNA